MKTILIVVLFVGGCLDAEAQVPKGKEIFKQKKTQREYLIKQIAALKIYFQYLKKGYEIAGKGLNTVGDIKNGSFDLDKEHLNSLKQVSPVVRNSPKVDDILLYNHQIKVAFRKLYEDCQGDENLSPEEIGYIQAVYANMLRECNASLDELDLIVTAGETEMSEDERLQRLHRVYLDMLEKYSFTQDFVGGTRLLCLERAKEKYQVKTLSALYTVQ